MSHTQEGRKRIGEASKARWNDPEYRRRVSESRRSAWARWREERKAEVVTRQCETCANQFAPRVDTQKYCSRKCANASPEVRRRKRESSKLRWTNPEYRKQMASRRPAWSEWRRKAELAADTRKCEICGHKFVPKIKHGSNAQKYCPESSGRKCRDIAYNRRLSADPMRRARRNEKERARLAADPAHRESRRKSYRKYLANHPDRAKAATKRWISKNREHLAEYARFRRERNPEKFRQQQRDYWRRLSEAARRKTPGAKRNPIFAEAYKLRQNNVTWGKIAIKLLPSEYRIDPEGTLDKLKKGVKYLRQKAKP